MFAGQGRQFFSAAQHCIAVSSLVSEKLTGEGFAYNFYRAYMPQVLDPASWELLRKAVIERFGLRKRTPNDVVFADALARSTEMRELTAFPSDSWRGMPKPMSTGIIAAGHEAARAKFLRQYDLLKKEGLLK